MSLLLFDYYFFHILIIIIIIIIIIHKPWAERSLESDHRHRDHAGRVWDKSHADYGAYGTASICPTRILRLGVWYLVAFGSMLCSVAQLCTSVQCQPTHSLCGPRALLCPSIIPVTNTFYRVCQTLQ